MVFLLQIYRLDGPIIVMIINP